jgi:hypothetical protein
MTYMPNEYNSMPFQILLAFCAVIDATALLYVLVAIILGYKINAG